MSKDLEITEENMEALSTLPYDIALALGPNVGAMPRKQIGEELARLTTAERLSKGIVASQAIFEAKMFIQAQKAFDLLARAMEPGKKKSERPDQANIAAAKQIIEIYAKRFPRVVDVKPQVIVDKKVHNIPTSEKAWFVRKGALMHGATWKAAEKALADKGAASSSGCALNSGGPCVGEKGSLPDGSGKAVDVSALDRVDSD